MTMALRPAARTRRLACLADTATCFAGVAAEFQTLKAHLDLAYDLEHLTGDYCVLLLLPIADVLSRHRADQRVPIIGVCQISTPVRDVVCAK